VRDAVKPLQAKGISVQFIDERYTTPRTASHDEKRSANGPKRGDPNAAAASQILDTFWSIDNRKNMS
jgi:RNase H-fold protein (predicted Holliday junction resolvase)